MIRYFLFLLLISTATVANAPAAYGQQAKPSVSKEYKYKLAFLYKFAQYVVSPRTVRGGEISIAVVGQNPFGSTLGRIASKHPRGLKCVPRVYESVSDYRESDIVFVTRGVPASEVQKLIAATKGTSTLVVGETAGFLDVGGVMNFHIGVDGRLKIHLNANRAKGRNLEVDARLLSICQIQNGP